MADGIALLVIDMQESMARSQTPGDPRVRLLSTIRVLVRQAQFYSIPVGYVWTPTLDVSRDTRAPMVDRPAKPLPTTLEDGLLEELLVLPKDFVVTKPGWSAFNFTALGHYLARLDIHTLVVTGIATNLSVESTVRDAYDHRFHVITISDGMLGTSKDEHYFTITRIFPRISRVMTSTELVNWLGTSKGGAKPRG